MNRGRTIRPAPTSIVAPPLRLMLWLLWLNARELREWLERCGGGPHAFPIRQAPRLELRWTRRLERDRHFITSFGSCRLEVFGSLLFCFPASVLPDEHGSSQILDLDIWAWRMNLTCESPSHPVRWPNYFHLPTRNNGLPETDMTCRLDFILFQTPRGHGMRANASPTTSP